MKEKSSSFPAHCARFWGKLYFNFLKYLKDGG